MKFKNLALLFVGLSSVVGAVTLYFLPEPIKAISQKWESSPHADTTSEAFTHWDEEDPPRIPEECAKCHSTLGYRDFLGADGSSALTVDSSAKTGTPVYCAACHNPSAHAMTQVRFPSGAEIGELGPEANCLQCHQGRKAGADVVQATSGMADDTVSEELAFVNVHYAIAAATWLGTEAGGGYEYPDRSYVTRFKHVPDLQTCDDCHDPHSQIVDPKACSPCHVAVVDREDLAAIRISDGDYDGDGDEEEGLAGEIETLQQRTYSALQAYAVQVTDTPLLYADRFPYFFVDTNGNGEAEEDEISFQNQYAAWTPRLLRTAYNYHFSLQDPGNYIHNGLYVLQLLYDSLDDLGQRISVDNGELHRPVSR
jgi:hypothetical protein